MSRHEGVSCDSCNKSNFRGKRFKCLTCYDYDLCATCYENGATTTRHTADHPMQCILTRADFELYYGGEAFTADQPQAFTCPFCGKMGYTESLLQEHVTADHADASAEVVCPVCAALPGGDPNHVTDDFAAHLTLEHRAPRDLIDEPATARHVRRLFHPGGGVGRPRPPRPRAGNMHFGSSAGGGLPPASSSSSSSATTNARENMDPIAELLSQLSGVRRAAQQSQPPVQSQLQLLQQQLQLERQQVQQTRERLERLPRRQMAASSTTTATVVASPEPSSASSSSFLLSRANASALSETEKEDLEMERADRSLFVQDLILSTLGSAVFRTTAHSSSEDKEMDDLSQQIRSMGQEPLGASAGLVCLRSSTGPLGSAELESDLLNHDIEVISLESEEDKDS